MVDTGTALIVGSFMSLFGMVILLQINNNNWFKRQQWKLDAGNIKAENKLRLKKLEKDMGLNTRASKKEAEELPQGNLLGQLAPLLKNLDGETLKSLADTFLPNSIEEEAPEGISGALLNFAEENPEIVNGILQGISGKMGGNNTGPSGY